MTDERWKEIKGRIVEKFVVLCESEEALLDAPGTVEIIEFQTPAGKFRLERTDQPLVLDKKVIGSKRIGSEPKVEFVYSETERVHKFKAYQWNNETESWKEITMERDSFIV